MAVVFILLPLKALLKGRPQPAFTSGGETRSGCHGPQGEYPCVMWFQFLSVFLLNF